MVRGKCKEGESHFESLCLRSIDKLVKDIREVRSKELDTFKEGLVRVLKDAG